MHRILAAVNVARDDLDKAVYHQERALSLNPNDDLMVVQPGEILTWLEQPEEGIDWIKKAMRLNPYHPERFWHHLARAYIVARRYAEAIDACKRVATLDHQHHALLAACHAVSATSPRRGRTPTKRCGYSPSFASASTKRRSTIGTSASARTTARAC